MKRTASVVVISIASVLVFGSTSCSDQTEGERCDSLNGSEDCESGLECVPARQLLLSDGTDRCCPPASAAISDDRCRRTSGGTATGGTGGTGGISGDPGGGAGTAGTSQAGTAGTSQAGTAGTSQAGAAGTSQAGTAGTSQAGAAGAD